MTNNYFSRRNWKGPALPAISYLRKKRQCVRKSRQEILPWDRARSSTKYTLFPHPKLVRILRLTVNILALNGAFLSVIIK